MISVIHIVGARPQFVKLAPLYHQMNNAGFSQEILHTGQHYDSNMSDNFFTTLDIPSPNFNLAVNNLSHGAMTGRMIEKIEQILQNKSYNYIILYGDTNSTLAGAIAGKKLKFKIIHIESGVRNNDNFMPEEINRVLTDRISDLLFCSTCLSYNNLINEGLKFNNSNCYNVGDLMFESFVNNYKNNCNDISNNILFTCHREENVTKNNLVEIISALNQLSKQFKIIFPAHPSTKNKIIKYGIECNFQILDPMLYRDLLDQIAKSKFIITDSGGLIKEAYWLEKPSLSIMRNPVWPELLDANVSYNATPAHRDIINGFQKLELIKKFKKGIFGSGDTSKRIVDIIIKNYKNE
ncbi:MAG: UDP-N-acetylglucosamine 2-epimerase (non-hydrolyzing) [Flavobacteriaceae bacterium]|jgi:UDP-GlcNAc3NAcA epimerase|nr:UDP-N-acetylglucosamine 2-epimerase (non-hydrolyzing) [Flavobacteriaceae bacterium]